MIKDEHISRYIGVLANRFRREIDKLSSRDLCSGAQGKALHFILAHEDSDIFQKDIEEEFGLRPPSASALIKKLEQNGLIKREAVDFDGRYKKITASDKALKNKETVINGVEALEERLLDGISEDEIKEWVAITNKMINNL